MASRSYYLRKFSRKRHGNKRNWAHFPPNSIHGITTDRTIVVSGAMELICFAAFVVLRIRWQHGPQWSAKGYSLVFQLNGWWLVEIPYWFKITFFKIWELALVPRKIK